MQTFSGLSRSHPKIFFACSVLLFSLIVTAAVYLLVMPWDPALSPDTLHDYYPAQYIVNLSSSDWSETLLSPFYRQTSYNEISPAESKPVFIVALRLWGLLYRTLISSQETLPNAREFMWFVLFNCWLLFIIICMIARRIGESTLGFAAGIIVMICPWSLIFLYFPAYTQFSMVLFLFGFLALLKRTYFSTVLGGILSSLALLSNNAVIVYVFGLFILTVFSHMPDWKRALRYSLVFTASFFSLFLFFEVLKYTPIIGNASEFDSPLEILINYYGRSLHRNHFPMADVPKYPGMMLLIVKHNSLVMFGLFIAVPFVLFLKVIKQGWNAFYENATIRNVLMLWIPAVAGILAIDMGPGIQLGRTYFIAYPLLVLGVMILLKDITIRRRAFQLLILIVFIFYAKETIGGLKMEREAFHGFQNYIHLNIRQGEHIALLKEDAYLPYILKLLALKFPIGLDDKVIFVNSISDGELLGRGAKYFVTGPEVSTICDTKVSTAPSKKMGGVRKAGGEFSDDQAVVLPQKKIPFFGLYPLLMFEDELVAWDYISKKVNNTSYRKDGAITVWNVLPNYWMNMADANGDGKADLLYFETAEKGGRFLMARLFAGEGFADPKPWLRFDSDYPRYIRFADMNRDRKADVVYFDTANNFLVVRYSDGERFADPVPLFGYDSDSLQYSQIADINGDGIPDLLSFEFYVVSTQLKIIWMCLSNAEGFTGPEMHLWHGRPVKIEQLRFTDANGDGRDDLLFFETTEKGGKHLFVSLSTGNGYAKQKLWFKSDSIPEYVRFADVNGDKKADMLYLDSELKDRMVLFVSLSSGHGYKKPEPWFEFKSRDIIYTEFADVNGDGRADLVYFDTKLGNAFFVVSLSTGNGFVSAMP